VQVIGRQTGTLTCHSITFSTVHGLYRDIYAYRERLTDVVVQHLSSSALDADDETGARLTIRCHDIVKKISVYKDNLAVSVKR